MPLRDTARFLWQYLLVALTWLLALPRFLLRSLLGFVSLILTVILLVLLVEVFWVSPRNLAYRYASPTLQGQSDPCSVQSKNPTALATFDNSEDALQRSLKGQAGLECMLQFHMVPTLTSQPHATWYNSSQPIGPISFYLSFLEFQESGRPAEIGLDGSLLQRSQLEVLENHLSKQKNNYVLVFIHGWRHDARIGDDNVANARVYAAHAASALDYRCKTTGKYCDHTVTAVFVGWRGARVNEPAIAAFADRYLSFLGSSISSTFKSAVGGFPAMLTLFDRKPISERIAPSVVASLQHVDRLLKGRNIVAKDKLIVIGHSLGGNMLATGLNSVVIDQIRNYRPGEILASPLGNLVVLLNPAAEAWKWTSFQHEMRLHVHFPVDSTDADQKSKADVNYFPPNQPPIYVSITSASSWPATPLTQLEKNSLPSGRDEDTEEMTSTAHYDAATHDAFPLFKGNFQPVAETLDRLASWFPNSKPGQSLFFSDKSICPEWQTLRNACESTIVGFLRLTSGLFRNLPFANADSDETLTIGHLDPMRPPYGDFKSSNWQSPLPFGATGEVIVNNENPDLTQYRNAGSAYLSECAIVDHWLWKARHNPALRPFEGWDSGYSRVPPKGAGVGPVIPDRETPNVTPIRPRPTTNGHLEIQFRQYLLKSGTASIVTSNDPMWDLRAYDTTLAFHGGYVTYPLMCALNQLVMDDIASEPKN